MFLSFDENDLTNLPEKDDQRFLAMFYFATTVSSSTGYGDILAISTRARVFNTFMMMLSYSGLIMMLSSLINI